MSWTLVNFTVKQSADGATVTTDPMGTSGADLIIVIIAMQAGTGASFTNSQGDQATYTQVDPTGQAAAGFVLRAWYKANPSTHPTAHQFGITGTGEVPSIYVFAWTGANTSTPFGLSIGATSDSAAVNTLNVGPITTNANDLIISAVSNFADTATNTRSIGSGFTLISGQVGFVSSKAAPLATATKLQTGSSETPTWTWGSGGTNQQSYSNAILLTFKMASGGGGTPPTITSITPNSVVSNASVAVIYKAAQIVGTNFNVAFSGGPAAITFSDADATVSGTPTITATLITLDVRIAAAAAANTGTVQVQTNDGTATKAFSITTGGGGGGTGLSGAGIQSSGTPFIRRG